MGDEGREGGWQWSPRPLTTDECCNPIGWRLADGADDWCPAERMSV